MFVYNVLSVFRFQPMALKAGLVDLWKWRVWVKQKEEALLKVILNKKRIASPFISELHFEAILDFGKQHQESEESHRAPTLHLTSLTQLHRSLLMMFRLELKFLFNFC